MTPIFHDNQYEAFFQITKGNETIPSYETGMQMRAIPAQTGNTANNQVITVNVQRQCG